MWRWLHCFCMCNSVSSEWSGECPQMRCKMSLFHLSATLWTFNGKFSAKQSLTVLENKSMMQLAMLATAWTMTLTESGSIHNFKDTHPCTQASQSSFLHTENSEYIYVSSFTLTLLKAIVTLNKNFTALTNLMLMFKFYFYIAVWINVYPTIQMFVVSNIFKCFGKKTLMLTKAAFFC